MFLVRPTGDTFSHFGETELTNCSIAQRGGREGGREAGLGSDLLTSVEREPWVFFEVSGLQEWEEECHTTSRSWLNCGDVCKKWHIVVDVHIRSITPTGFISCRS